MDIPYTIAVHVCCAPCSISVIDALRKEGHVVLGIFFNPNIHPLREYLARRESMVALAEKANLPVIWADEGYNIREWLSMIADDTMYGRRCVLCYTQRLQYVRDIAVQRGIQAFTTTLLYSKRQLHDTLLAVGDALTCDETTFKAYDFRYLWQEGIDRSREEGYYRQSYCGCIYSEEERFEKKLQKLITTDNAPLY